MVSQKLQGIELHGVSEKQIVSEGESPDKSGFQILVLDIFGNQSAKCIMTRFGAV
jgi:hypothetical protein